MQICINSCCKALKLIFGLKVNSSKEREFYLYHSELASTTKGADEASGDDYELCVTVNNAPGIALLAFLAVSLAATVISCGYCKRISRSGNRKKKERLLKS